MLLASALSVSGQVVTNTNDSGVGSLRDALLAGFTNINFDPTFFSSPQTITLASELPTVFGNLSINGPGADLLTIEGSFTSAGTELLFIQNGMVSVSDITFSGASNAASPTGSSMTGIFSRGDLTLANVVVSDIAGNGVLAQGGTVTLNSSSVINNDEIGVFVQAGSATVNNSTVAGNLQEGILLDSGQINNSTIVNNGANGIFTGLFPNLSISSTIVANNASGDLFSFANAGISITDSLIESGGSFASNGVNGNIVGIDPQLGSLSINGGSTPTLLPSLTSVVVDSGSNGNGLVVDQRGVGRVIGAGIDIGAVEVQVVPVPEPGSVGLVAAILLTAMLRRKKRTTGL